MKNPAPILASALWLSLAAAAAAQTVVPVQPLAPLTTGQLAQFLTRFQVTQVVIQGSDKKLKDDPALKGVLGQVLAAAQAQQPQQPARDSRDPDLPLTMQIDAAARTQRHIIFHDTHDEHFNANWKKQAELVREALLRQGVPEDNIQVVELQSREDFFCALSNAEGPRRVYFFGHGSPLVLHIGDEKVDVRQDIGALQQEQVQILTHYGCSFVNLSTGDLRGVQQAMQADSRIMLVGHRLPSTPYDDRMFDPGNPIVRVNVSPAGSSMHFAQDELAGRVAAIGHMLGTPATGLGPALAGAGTSIYVSEQGRTPERLPDPPDPLVDFFRRFIRRGTTPPAPATPTTTPDAPSTTPRPPATPGLPGGLSVPDWLRNLVPGRSGSNS